MSETFLCALKRKASIVSHLHTLNQRKKAFIFFPATTSPSENKRHRFFAALAPTSSPKSFHWEFEIHEKILPEIMIRANLKA